MEKRLAFALDVDSSNQAVEILDGIEDRDIIVKIGYSLFIRDGLRLCRTVKDFGFELFLDLKLHDIPNTVYNGVKAATELGADYLTVHTLGGPEMLSKAVEAKKGTNLKLLGVTILTSHSEDYTDYIQTNLTLPELTVKLGKTAVELGIDGLVCSSKEVKSLRESISKNFIAVVPGIRFDNISNDDQTRVATPWEAVKNGADIIVVGRPVLKSKDKNQVIKQIKESIRS